MQHYLYREDCRGTLSVIEKRKELCHNFRYESDSITNLKGLKRVIDIMISHIEDRRKIEEKALKIIREGRIEGLLTHDRN